MRLLSFEHAGQASYGVMTSHGIIDVGARLADRYADLGGVLAAGALDAIERMASTAGAALDVEAVTFLPPVTAPQKIFCIGLNYESHRRETGRDRSRYPTVFTRFASSLTGHRQALVKPRASDEFDYEGELAVVIGKAGRRIGRRSAMAHVAGFSCFNDASVRDFQRHTSQFTPGKNFPATGGFGPCLVTTDEIRDVNRLGIQTRLNGAVMQDADTSRLIFDIPTLIAYLSSFTRLEPGDVIATGTPGGVGFKREPPVFLTAGDEVVVDIESVGTLVNPIVAE